MTQGKVTISTVYTKKTELNEIQDNYIISTDVETICDYTELSDRPTSQKTLENLLHVYNSMEDALLDYVNQVHKVNPCILSVNKVGIFYYVPNRNSNQNISGEVTLIQTDLSASIPVSTEDLDNTSGFLTVVDLADYLKDVDVVNNLTSDAIDRPLSAYQGKYLKSLIPTDTSDLNNTAGFITSGSISSKADKTNGASQITDGNGGNYANISNSLTSNSTQQNINSAINSALANNVTLNNLASSITSTENSPVAAKTIHSHVDSKISTHNGDSTAHSTLFNSKVGQSDVDSSISTHNSSSSAHSTLFNSKVGQSDVDTSISTHNSSNSAHSALFSSKVGQSDVDSSISTHNSSSSAHSTLFNSKVGQSDVDSSISTHNSSSSAHSTLFNAKLDKTDVTHIFYVNGQLLVGTMSELENNSDLIVVKKGTTFRVTFPLPAQTSNTKNNTFFLKSGIAIKRANGSTAYTTQSITVSPTVYQASVSANTSVTTESLVCNTAGECALIFELWNGDQISSSNQKLGEVRKTLICWED